MAFADDYGYDGCLAVARVETQVLPRLLEVVGVLPEVLGVLWLGLEDIYGGYGCCGNRGRV